jgi:hypothetical protein
VRARHGFAGGKVAVDAIQTPVTIAVVAVPESGEIFQLTQ